MAKKMNMITGVAALALVFGAGPAFAQYGNTTQQQGRQSGSTADRDNSQPNSKNQMDETFAKKAAQGGIAEVKLGQLAEERGSNPAVKSFGRRMVQDHTKANDELKSTTSRENVELPTELDKSDEVTYDRLSKLSGEAFDRAYARDMVRDHSKDVADFQKEAKDGHDQAIKNFAAQTLPTLQSHLDQARQMEQAVNQASNSNAPAGSTGSTYPSNNRTTPSSNNPNR